MTYYDYNGHTYIYRLIPKKQRKGKPIFHVAFLSDEKGKNNRRKHRLQKSTKQTNEKAAHKVAQRMITDGVVNCNNESLTDYLLDFWNPKKSGYLESKKVEGRIYSHSHISNSYQRLKDHVIPYFQRIGVQKLSDLRKEHIIGWRNYLYKHGYLPEFYENSENERKIKILSPTTQYRTLQALRTALNWAVEIEMIPRNPAKDIIPVKQEQRRASFFEKDELKRLFAVNWKNGFKLDYTAALLSVTSGMRLGEIRGLKVKNLHLESRTIDVVFNYVAKDGLKMPKTQKSIRCVSFSETTKKAFINLLASSPFSDDSESFVFFTPNSRDRPCGIHQITDGLKHAMSNAGINGNHTFHSFRHTFTTLSADKIPFSLLQQLVGHTQKRTTEGYTHISKEHLELAREVSDSII